MGGMTLARGAVAGNAVEDVALGADLDKVAMCSVAVTARTTSGVLVSLSSLLLGNGLSAGRFLPLRAR